MSTCQLCKKFTSNDPDDTLHPRCEEELVRLIMSLTSEELTNVAAAMVADSPDEEKAEVRTLFVDVIEETEREERST